MTAALLLMASAIALMLLLGWVIGGVLSHRSLGHIDAVERDLRGAARGQ